MMEYEVNQRVVLTDPVTGKVVEGRVYERHESDSPPYRGIYGVRLDEPQWFGTFCTEVLHVSDDALTEP